MNLPDLLVKEIGLSKNCEYSITIANNGSAGVPESSYSGNNSVSIQLSMGHTHALTIELRALDPKGQLKSPGGTVTYVWAPIIASKQFDLDSPKIKVVVDPTVVGGVVAPWWN